METNGSRQSAGAIEAKRGIRQQVKSARQGLSASYREAASRRIRQHVLLWLEHRPAGTVFCYVSDDREPDTRPLMEELLSRGIRVCVPRCCSGGRHGGRARSLPFGACSGLFRHSGAGGGASFHAGRPGGCVHRALPERGAGQRQAGPRHGLL